MTRERARSYSNSGQRVLQPRSHTLTKESCIDPGQRAATISPTRVRYLGRDSPTGRLYILVCLPNSQAMTEGRDSPTGRPRRSLAGQREARLRPRGGSRRPLGPLRPRPRPPRPPPPHSPPRQGAGPGPGVYPGRQSSDLRPVPPGGVVPALSRPRASALPCRGGARPSALCSPLGGGRAAERPPAEAAGRGGARRGGAGRGGGRCARSTTTTRSLVTRPL